MAAGAELLQFSKCSLCDSIAFIWEVDVGGGALLSAPALICNPLTILSLVYTVGTFKYLCLNSTVSDITFPFVSDFTTL